MDANDQQHRAILQSIARRAMLEHGLLPDFSPAALSELERIQVAAVPVPGSVRDQTGLLWSSIDNDDSLDLDQLTVAEAMPGGNVKLLVAIADVDALVRDGTALDGHARSNTTSVYTAARIFPMLPEKLSTGLTSLNFNEVRLAVVVEMVIDSGGTVLNSDIYRASVRNRAKLAYNRVAAWLDGKGSIPEAIPLVPHLDENLRLQDQAAQCLKNTRHVHGALTLQTIQAKAVFDGDLIQSLEVDQPNRAKELIEEFMIAANGVGARFLTANNFPSMRRVVRTPEHWDRIVELAAQHKYVLSAVPDPKALEDFLAGQAAADPLRFPDLSLAVIKLLGSGEYVAELPVGNVPRHFGLAGRDYAHSTSPNPRYPYVITQRLLKSALGHASVPYTKDDLDALAA